MISGKRVYRTSSSRLACGQEARPTSDGEYYQKGFPVRQHPLCIAAFPNAEGSKVGQRIGDLVLPHLFFRQTFGFGGEQEHLESDQLQLAEDVDVSRLTLTLGRMTTGDQFDANSYAHNPLTQFLNWALVNNGAYDYAGDSYGFIEGLTLELSIRSLGRFATLNFSTFHEFQTVSRKTAIC